MLSQSRRLALIVRMGTRICALPLGAVKEVMRPLAIEPISGMPPFVLGLSLIRGSPAPVVALVRFFDEFSDEPITRFVVLQVGQRVVALAVGGVAGIHELQLPQLQDMPPLLRDAHADAIEAIGRLDEQLLIVLNTGNILPEAAYEFLWNREQ